VVDPHLLPLAPLLLLISLVEPRLAVALLLGYFSGLLSSALSPLLEVSLEILLGDFLTPELLGLGLLNLLPLGFVFLIELFLSFLVFLQPLLDLLGPLLLELALLEWVLITAALDVFYSLHFFGLLSFQGLQPQFLPLFVPFLYGEGDLLLVLLLLFPIAVHFRMG